MSAPSSQKSDSPPRNQEPAGGGSVTGVNFFALSAIGAWVAPNRCDILKTGTNGQCLFTGDADIEGVFWFSVFADAAGVSTNDTQNADIYNLARPGELRKPYSVTVVDLLHQADTIDWSTHTFKGDQLSVVDEITAQHGDGLNQEQLSALFELKVC